MQKRGKLLVRLSAEPIFSYIPHCVTQIEWHCESGNADFYYNFIRFHQLIRNFPFTYSIEISLPTFDEIEHSQFATEFTRKLVYFISYVGFSNLVVKLLKCSN